MALIQKRHRRTTIFMVVLGAVAVLGVGYFVVARLLPTPEGTVSDETIGGRDLKIITEFGEDVFTDPRFQSLQRYGDPPVTVDPSLVGRDNPFAPLL